MHAETKRNASRVTCSNCNEAPTVSPAASGAKNKRVWVDTTPACFTGRMASM